MATELTFHPLVDGVLTLARIEQRTDGHVHVEEYALERDAHAEVVAILAAAGHDPPELVRRRAIGLVRRVGWLHLSSAA